MPEARTIKCPNCSAPLLVPLGEVEIDCEYCDSRVRFIPGSEELEVVRTREEMKYRERVALERERLRKRLEQEEAARWRQTAARVAIAALPVLGRSVGRAAFDAALRRGGGGCLGYGCLVPIALLGFAGLLVISFLL
jgi:DNA-directed RNA polymerase subunit RPC12/RpoP